MSFIERRVVLPDGRLVIEKEAISTICGENQPIYSYHNDHGLPISKTDFELDYWGRILGLKDYLISKELNPPDEEDFIWFRERNRDLKKLEKRSEELKLKSEVDGQGGTDFPKYDPDKTLHVKNDALSKANKQAREEIKSLMNLEEERKGFNKYEPPPQKNDYPAVWDLVVQDMKQRDEEGLKKYGTRLQPFNGRDPLIDMYQESLDRIAYLRQLLFEKYGE